MNVYYVLINYPKARVPRPRHHGQSKSRPPTPAVRRDQEATSADKKASPPEMAPISNLSPNHGQRPRTRKVEIENQGNFYRKNKSVSTPINQKNINNLILISKKMRLSYHTCTISHPYQCIPCSVLGRLQEAEPSRASSAGLCRPHAKSLHRLARHCSCLSCIARRWKWSRNCRRLWWTSPSAPAWATCPAP